MLVKSMYIKICLANGRILELNAADVAIKYSISARTLPIDPLNPQLVDFGRIELDFQANGQYVPAYSQLLDD